MDGRARLAKLLKDKGAQAKLAREADCSEPHLSLYLSGHRRLSITMATRISKVTKIPAAELLGLSEPAA